MSNQARLAASRSESPFAVKRQERNAFSRFVSAEMRSLSPAEKAQFEQDGYLVLRNFFPAHTAAALLSRSKELIRDFDLKGHPMTTFVADKVDEVSQIPSTSIAS